MKRLTVYASRQIRQKYQAPLIVVHRAGRQRVLHSVALAAGAQIRVSCQVVEVDCNFEARVKLKDGEWVEGDIILGADGIKSSLRREISKRYGYDDVSLPTGDAAYRISILKEDMKGDEQTLKLLAGSVSMRWMGPGGHVCHLHLLFSYC
jgi:salicylate hydroxylase